MACSNKLFPFLFSPLIAWSATISDWTHLPAGGIVENTTGSFSYNETQTQNFVLKDNIFFQNPSASLSVRTTISGNWKASNSGMIFYGDNQGKYTFNKGNISFYINSSGIHAFGEDAYFQLRNQSSLDINANLTITASAMSNFSDVGLFGITDSIFKVTDADLRIDLSNTHNPNIFYLTGNSNVEINSGGNRAKQNIFLKGGIEVKDTSSLTLNLSNQNSYFQGAVSLSNSAKFTLNLSNSSATFTTYSQQEASATLSLENASILNATIIGDKTDFIMSGDSVWNMWGQDVLRASMQNNIRNLTISGATVNFMSNEDGTHRFGQDFKQKTLQGTGTLTGSGTFAIYADVGAKSTDNISFSHATGSHKFAILYNPNTFSQILAEEISTKDNMIIATINDSTTQATFSALPTVMGLTSYTTHLERIDGVNSQWFITHITPDGQSPLAKALTTALNTPYRLFESSSQTLNLRLGDLRNYPKNHGVYFHYTIAQNSFVEDDNLASGKDLFMSIVGGYDMNASYRGHNDFLGFGFEVNLLDATTNLFTSSTQSYGGFLYYTSIWDNRFYYDIVLKYAYSPTDINLKSLASNTAFSAHLLNLSAEVGKKFAFNSNPSFPYAEIGGKLTTGMISSSSLSTKDPNENLIQAETKFQFPLLIRSSLYFGYEWNSRFIGDLKAGVFIDYSLFNGSNTLLSDRWSRFSKSFDMDFDVGVSIISNITLQDYLRFYLQLDSSFLGNYSTDILFNAGIRWSFGDRYVPPPPPPADPKRLKIKKIRGNTIRDIPTIKQNDRTNMKYHEENRNQIINSYKSSNQQFSNNDENGNTNGLYPQDNYTSETLRELNERRYKENIRDFYQPQQNTQRSRRTGRYYQNTR